MMHFRIRTIIFFLFFFLLIPDSGALSESLLSLASPYKKVLRKYTREGKSYGMRNLDTVYRWYATYQSPQFREALHQRLAKLYPYGISDQILATIESSGNDQQMEFFIALYARDRGLKRMVGKENLWKITLIVDNESISPVKVDRLRKTPYLERFYPYLDKWYSGYRVVFPYNIQNSTAKKVSLALSSVGGTSQVSFKIPR